MSQQQGNTVPNLRLAEMKEFGRFTAAEGRYIRRSLDVAKGTPGVETLWGRNADEEVSIAKQRVLYAVLPEIREMVKVGSSVAPIRTLMLPLMELTLFDLLQGSLSCFSAYRFLYERLIGSRVRPWLPSAFCGMAAMPDLKPERRKLLLQSIHESAATAPGWSEREPFFFPNWIDKDLPISE